MYLNTLESLIFPLKYFHITFKYFHHNKVEFQQAFHIIQHQFNIHHLLQWHLLYWASQALNRQANHKRIMRFICEQTNLTSLIRNQQALYVRLYQSKYFQVLNLWTIYFWSVHIESLILTLPLWISQETLQYTNDGQVASSNLHFQSAPLSYANVQVFKK